MLTALLLLATGCNPEQSPSPERQAEARGTTNYPLLGPAELGPVERWYERDLEAEENRASAAATTAERDETADIERWQAAAAWDLRLLDLLAAHLDVTAQIAEAVAARGETPELRAWADRVTADTVAWRAELATLRGRWYGNAASPRLAGAPDVADLGPLSQRLVERWRRGEGEVTAPRRPTAAEVLPTDGVGVLRPGIEPVEPPPGPVEPFVRVATRSLDRVGTDRVPTRVAEEILAPLARRALDVATAGTMQASREELRAVAARIQLGQQRALVELGALARGGGDRRG